MRNQIKTVVTLFVLTVIGLAAWEGLRRAEPEPDYRGKGLRAWLASYREHVEVHSPEAALADSDAIRTIGTNAIPTMLSMLRERDSVLHSKLIMLWNNPVVRTPWLPSWLRYPTWVRNCARVQNESAMYGFEILRGDGQQAVPALIEIYEQNISSSSQWAASWSLVLIGPAASNSVPAFLRAATNRDGSVRESAVAALNEMKLEPRLVVPVLVDSLNDPRWTVRDAAAMGLARIGPAARQAIPALVQSLNDTNRFVHRSVTYALKQIDPVAAAKAGINTNSLGL